MDKHELLKSYHSHLIALERRAPLTAETYGFEIRRFLDWLEAEKLTVNSSASNEAGFSDVTDYVKYRKTVDKIDSRSVAKAVSALKSFYRFLAEERLLARTAPEDDSSVADRVSLLETPRTARRFPAVLKNGEAEKLFSLIDTSGPLGIRNRAIYDFIFSAGVRISEVVNLNIGDVILSERVAHVRGKGSKERIVIFGEESAAWLSRYLNEVRPLFLKHRRSSAFFVSRKGKRLSRKGIWKHYSTLASQNGTDTRLHTLRHTFATELLAGGADLRSVQELLGHADLATTQIYTHVDSSVLRENHRQFLPQLKSWRKT